MFIFESVAVEVIGLCIPLIIGLYFYYTRNFNFWKERSVTFVKPLPFLGSLKDVALQRITIGHQLKKLYDEYKNEPYVGIYSFDQPALMVRDLDLIKKIMVKDAQNFLDHMLDLDEDLDPLGARGLFMMKGKKWKHMRNGLTPTFTSGKMKNMFNLVERCAKELDNYMDTASAGASPVEIKEATAKFTTDVIASCAFGIESNTLKDPNAEFRNQLRKVFVTTPLKGLITYLAIVAPRLLKTFHLQFVEESVYDFVRSTLWNTAKYRREKGITRRDFLDSLVELKRKNDAENKSTANQGDGNETFKLIDDDYAAQALTFLTAGFETSSSTISFTLYQMALNPEIQRRLRNEITTVLKEHNNEVTYDAIKEMNYLDMAVNETLRLYPILPFLDRKCLSDYEIPSPTGKGTVTITSGMPIYIPLMGIQHDPEYFPEPEKYDPERFTEENKQSRPAYTHMPFGEGPRMCIGNRFAFMKIKLGLIHILSRFEISPCKDTPIPLVLDKRTFLLQTTSGIPLTLKKINT